MTANLAISLVGRLAVSKPALSPRSPRPRGLVERGKFRENCVRTGVIGRIPVKHQLLPRLRSQNLEDRQFLETEMGGSTKIGSPNAPRSPGGCIVDRDDKFDALEVLAGGGTYFQIAWWVLYGTRYGEEGPTIEKQEFEKEKQDAERLAGSFKSWNNHRPRGEIGTWFLNSLLVIWN